MNFQCRKCGEDAFVLVCPVFSLSIGWHFTNKFPFLHHGPHETRSGFLCRCTRHGCGREWVATARGMFEPGVTTPARVAAAPPTPPRERERDRDDDRSSEGHLRGAVARADV